MTIRNIESTEAIDDDVGMRFLGILYYGDQWHMLAASSNRGLDPITSDL